MNPARRCGATWWRSWSSKPAWGSTKSQVGSIPIHLRHFPAPPFKMFKRIPQPPVNRRPARPGTPRFLAGLRRRAGRRWSLAFCGARHLTSVDTVDGNIASEIQLVKAFSVRRPAIRRTKSRRRRRQIWMAWPTPPRRWTAGPNSRPTSSRRRGKSAWMSAQKTPCPT